MEKNVKVAKVTTMPIKHQDLASLIRRAAKFHNAPAKKTRANTSNAAATYSAASAINGDSNPAEAKYFWNCANRSRPTHKNVLPPMALSTTLNNQKQVQKTRIQAPHNPLLCPHARITVSLHTGKKLNSFGL